MISIVRHAGHFVPNRLSTRIKRFTLPIRRIRDRIQKPVRQVYSKLGRCIIWCQVQNWRISIKNVSSVEAVSQVSRSASGVTHGVTQKADKSVSGFFLRFAHSGTRPTPIKHFAPYETTSVGWVGATRQSKSELMMAKSSRTEFLIRCVGWRTRQHVVASAIRS
jgi:hypothetical protein